MSDVFLNTYLQQARGVIGRYPDPDERFIFEFDDVDQRTIHMVGVRRPLQVTWLVDEQVMQETVLEPWTGWDSARADCVIEQRPE